ncbi:unnamed protein product [Gongylonema pulchrum]|uniref:C2H2-type domain-containing protein n=1 Tax=Gongylonema pulchrum TaxID=637853 RepID=A0A183DP63_9BILA|nr:unnamed protein product [Gongylonema pulchrum]
MDSGKSPLAMLAKTCETIGLPDTPSRKSTRDSDKSKGSTSPTSSNSMSGETKKEESPAVKNKKEGSRSPRHTTHSPSVGKKTPIASEPSTSAAAAAASLPANLMLNSRNCFPMGFPSLTTAFPTFPYPSLMPGFPTMPTFAAAGAFPAGTPNPFLRCPDPLTCKGCPATMMTRSCVTPGCTSCTFHSATAAAVAGTSPAEMMMAFPPSFFAAATYNPLMTGALPPTSSSAAQIAYQNLMAAASGQATKHICNWIESSNGICGKSFNTADELATHMKVVHAPSTAANSSNGSDLKSSSSPRSTTAAPLINHAAAAASLRYHPYMKPNGLMPTMPNPLGVSPFPTMAGFPSAAALQAMYTQRLMATMPHP